MSSVQILLTWKIGKIHHDFPQVLNAALIHIWEKSAAHKCFKLFQNSPLFLLIWTAIRTSVTDLFFFFSPNIGWTRSLIYLSYNYKNYFVCSSSCSIAMSIFSCSSKHCFTMWRDHIGVWNVGQLNDFLGFFSIHKVFIHWKIASNYFQILWSCYYTGNQCLDQLGALNCIALVLFPT